MSLGGTKSFGISASYVSPSSRCFSSAFASSIIIGFSSAVIAVQAWIMHYQEIGVNRLFIHQTQDELLSFVNEIFQPLNNGKNKLLEETLLVYLERNGSVGETAKQLHIHINTLYQRLKKIEEKLNISFNNPEDVLKLQLARYLRGMVY